MIMPLSFQEEQQIISETSALNHLKVLSAFQQAKITTEAFHGSTGYGYNDFGKRKLEELYALVFKGESALVSSRFASGTHGIHVVLKGLLRPGDQMVSLTGTLYDTLEKSLSHKEGLIKRDGIVYSRVELIEKEYLDLEYVRRGGLANSRVAFIQRSRGYSQRKAISIQGIEELAQLMKIYAPNTLLVIDNCYGEFVEEREPLEVGADIVVGSLIKNPGGTLALSGSYIVGSKPLIEDIASAFTVPGIGDEIGWESSESLRLMFQGLYLAPGMVEQSLLTSIYTAYRFTSEGFETSPAPGEKRSDLIQSILFHNQEKLITFIQEIQANSPIDSIVKPLPWDMPGYDHPVIMASGSFIGGSSSELSADAPIRPPYAAYLQGGVNLHYSKIAIEKALKAVTHDF